jgi:AhpD family alkylhydroperoxidase
VSPLVVVDRPLCCSSGVIDPDSDPILSRFADDVAWLEGEGVAVERINPSADPEAFLAQIAVARTFAIHGNACLPVVLVAGEIVSTGHYPERRELARFAGVDGAVDSLITPAVRELVALGASIAANCEACFRFHYAAARKLGVSHADMAQAVGVAQTVKDTSAQAMLALAERSLSSRTGRAEPAPSAGCCGGPATGDASAPPSDCSC